MSLPFWARWHWRVDSDDGAIIEAGCGDPSLEGVRPVESVVEALRMFSQGEANTISAGVIQVDVPTDEVVVVEVVESVALDEGFSTSLYLGEDNDVEWVNDPW